MTKSHFNKNIFLNVVLRAAFCDLAIFFLHISSHLILGHPKTNISENGPIGEELAQYKWDDLKKMNFALRWSSIGEGLLPSVLTRLLPTDEVS